MIELLMGFLSFSLGVVDIHTLSFFFSFLNWIFFHGDFYYSEFFTSLLPIFVCQLLLLS